MKYGAMLAVLVSAIICFITSIVALNCVSKGSNDCARRSGIPAAVTSACLCAGVVVMLTMFKMTDA